MVWYGGILFPPQDLKTSNSIAVSYADKSPRFSISRDVPQPRANRHLRSRPDA